MEKEDLINKILKEFDEKYDTGDIVQQFEDIYGNIDFYNIKDEIKDFLKQTLQTELKALKEECLYIILSGNLCKEKYEDKFLEIIKAFTKRGI